MNFSDINFISILVAALSSFTLSNVWYSNMLFRQAWLESCGLTELDFQGASKNKAFVGTFLFSFVSAFLLSIFLGNDSDIGLSVVTGFSIGLFWVSSSLGLSYIYEQRPVKLFLINSGYYVSQFSLMGLILGGWP